MADLRRAQAGAAVNPAVDDQGPADAAADRQVEDRRTPHPRAEPGLISAEYESVPWRRLMVGLWEVKDRTLVRGVADYFRRRWDETHPPGRRVASVTVLVMRRQTGPPGSPPQPAVPVETYRWPEETGPGANP